MIKYVNCLISAIYNKMTINGHSQFRTDITSKTGAFLPQVNVLTFLKHATFTPIELCHITQGVINELKILEDNEMTHANITLEHVHLRKSILDVHYSFDEIPYSRYCAHFFDVYPLEGTVAYKPPEFFLEDIRSDHMDKIDPWAAGFTLYLMCVSDKERDSVSDIFKLYEKYSVRYVSLQHLYPWIEARREELGTHSDSNMCILLFHLLDPNPETRYSATQALEISKNLKVSDFKPFFLGINTDFMQ